MNDRAVCFVHWNLRLRFYLQSCSSKRLTSFPRCVTDAILDREVYPVFQSVYLVLIFIDKSDSTKTWAYATYNISYVHASHKLASQSWAYALPFRDFSIKPAAYERLVKSSQISPHTTLIQFIKKKCRTSRAARACITHHPWSTPRWNHLVV